MDEINEIKQLRKIQKVKAPDYLYTRIQAGIESARAERMPMTWSVALAASVTLLLVLSISALQQTSGATNVDDMSTFSSEMSLNASNHLYND